VVVVEVVEVFDFFLFGSGKNGVSGGGSGIK